MLSFSSVVSFHQKQRKQTWALNRIIDSKMMELILMAPNIKVIQNAENAENQNSIQLDTLKITNFCFKKMAK